MYIGLRRNVKFQRELGFVYFDDGSRIFRLSDSAFDTMRSACHLSPKVVLERYPSLFVAVRSRDETARRFVNAEVA